MDSINVNIDISENHIPPLVQCTLFASDHTT